MTSQDLPEVEELTEAMFEQFDDSTASLIPGTNGGTLDWTPELCGDGFVNDPTGDATILRDTAVRFPEGLGRGNFFLFVFLMSATGQKGILRETLNPSSATSSPHEEKHRPGNVSSAFFSERFLW